MAQVNAPNVAPKDDVLTTLIKGLGVASSIYGIRANMAQLDQYQKKQEHDDSLAAGKYNKNEQLELSGKFDVSPNKPASGNYQEIADANSGSPLYASLKKDNSPMLERIATMQNGKKGIAVVDQKALAQGKTPLQATVGFFESPPENKNPVKIETVDEQGNPITLLAADIAGQSFRNAPKADQKPNKDQFDAALYGRRIEKSNSILNDLASQGYNRASNMESIKDTILPGALQSNELKLQNQAERNFINAVLRRESGAAISSNEFKSGELQYFPRAGDTSEVLAQKAQNRDQAMLGMQAAAGNAWDKVPLAETASVKKDTSGTALAAPAQNGPSPLDLLQKKAQSGDKKAQDYLKSLKEGQ